MVATPDQTTPLSPEQSSKLKTKALQALGELPPFSPILSRLLATLAREDVSFGKIGELMETDTVIAGNILHLVNSAVYARRTRVNSVRHAISVLGVNKLRNAVLGMSVARLWKSVTMPANWSTARFNAHSAATAILSDFLVQHLEVEYPEGAFISGLMHDIGHLLIAWSLAPEYAEIQNRFAAGTPWSAAEMDVLGFTHGDLSGEAMTVWKLPEPVIIAVRDHHNIQGSGMTLGRVLSSADRYVKAEGYSIHTEPEGPRGLEGLVELGIPENLAAALVGDFKTECKAIMQFLE
jgi:HD-like signal output (HDOD) protein